MYNYLTFGRNTGTKCIAKNSEQKNTLRFTLKPFSFRNCGKKKKTMNQKVTELNVQI